MDDILDEAGLPRLTECGYVATNVSDVLILHSPGDPFFQLGCVSKFGQQDLEGDTGIHYMIGYRDAVKQAKKLARHRRIFLIDPRAQRWIEIPS
jgi:hypothetical protein